MNSVLCGFNALFLKSFVTDDYETYYLDAYIDYLRVLLTHLLNLNNLEGKIKQKSYQVTL